jgi:protein CpxP
MRRTMVIGALLLAGALNVPAAAQQRPRPQRAQAVAPRQEPGNRDVLERRVRQAFSRAVRQRVGLNDDQMRRLADVSSRFDQERRQLLREERSTRQSLREAMRDPSPDQHALDAGWSHLQEIQRKRLDINEREDRELATFMTPLQRARYHALQEQVRRRLEELRRSHRENALMPDSQPR